MAPDLFQGAMAGGAFLGSALCVFTPSETIYHAGFGLAAPTGPPVMAHTRFDLASLTKPLCTALLCMHAVSTGKLALDQTLGHLLGDRPVPLEKRAITIAQLLGHRSGLPAYEPWFETLIGLRPEDRPQVLLRSVLDAPLRAEPGSLCLYSDLGYFLLQHLIEAALGNDIRSLARELLYDPLGLDELDYRPLRAASDPTVPPPATIGSAATFAVTEYCPWRQRLLQGEVHDEHAYCLNGVAGHAGLFGTARAVTRLVTAVWDLYRGQPSPWPKTRLEPQVVRIFWSKPGTPDGSTWALGFDTPSARNSSAGHLFSPNSIGHLGFTGTSFWVDLDQEVGIVLLTNRVYPSRENDKLKKFRPTVHDALMKMWRGHH